MTQLLTGVTLAQPLSTRPKAVSAERKAPQQDTPAKDTVKVAAEYLPRKTIEEATQVVSLIHKNYAAQSVTWNDIATLLGVSEKNQTNKYPLWSAQAYGMLVRNEDHTFQVAETGRKIVAPEYSGEDMEGRVKALLTPKVLSKLFTDYNGRQLP